MARGRPVILDTRTFPNQASATKFFRDMLHRYKPGERVSADDGADLLALLKRHPEHETKVGSGVDHFVVVTADYSTHCFQIVRVDDTAERFSYPACISKRPND